MTLLAASNAKTLWYLTRGTGVVALLLLTAVLVLGIAATVRWQRPGWPRFLVADLHKHLTLLSIVFVAAHVVTTVADGFAPIRLLDAVVPFASPYRPIWLGLGAVAFDLLLALLVTSLVRARIGYGSWRVIHFLAYAAWPVALVHAFGTGSDGRIGWFALLGFGCVAAVGLAVAVRLLSSDRPAGVRVVAGAATVAVALTVFLWYRGGPAQQGWAARAGTPSSILRRHAARRTTVPAAPARTTFSTPFAASLDARLAQSRDASGDVGIAIAGNVAGLARPGNPPPDALGNRHGRGRRDEHEPRHVLAGRREAVRRNGRRAERESGRRRSHRSVRRLAAALARAPNRLRDGRP